MPRARDYGVKPRVATESEEQQALFGWARYASRVCPELLLMYHIPNEGKRSYQTGARMRAEGMRKGVPDVFLPVSRRGYHGMYIEMKRRKGGRVSPEQEVWLDELRKQGYYCVVSKGWEEAVKELAWYCEIEITENLNYRIDKGV